MKKLIVLATLLCLLIVPPAFALTPQEIAQNALASTVLVTITNSSGQSFFGSGFVIGEGQIATNYHVIEGIVTGTVSLVGNENKHTIESVIATDKAHDLAIIEATSLKAPPLPLGDSDSVVVGQAVYIAGNPQGLTGTFSEGILSAIRPEGNVLVLDTILQMTAPVSPGSSGGPMLNQNGEVIGVVFSQVTRGQNLNFAIPVNNLKTLLRTTADDNLVHILDPNLHLVIRKALNKTPGSPITPEEMATLTSINAVWDRIKDLTGLEFATNLELLDLRNNDISDLTPLQRLTRLEYLYLYNNEIQDISPLANLTNLKELNIGDNSILDISPLARLNRLTWLSLQDNVIWDISALSGLTRLETLYLMDNLLLDLSPLILNTGLGAGDMIDLRINSALNDASINTHIPALRQRGVTVHRTRLYLSGPETVSIGQTITLNLNVQDTVDLLRLQLDLDLYTTDFSIVSVAEGDFLKQNNAQTFFLEGRPNNEDWEKIELLRLDREGADGDGILLSITIKGNNIGAGRIYVDVDLLTATGETMLYSYSRSHYLEVVASWDINGDGQVNAADLAIIAQNIGKYDESLDLTGDEYVTIQDFILVAAHLGESVTSDALATQADVLISTDTIQAWLEMSHIEDDGSLTFKRGIANLERLLQASRPNATALLPNYPNPFNPETWIPYRLAEAADVILTIYDTKGILVRQFDLGHQAASYYTDRTKAAYWDGRNASGEPVASGSYFYQLEAGAFSATRKLVILK